MAIDHISYTDREDWLKKRREGIGGSEAGVIMELSRFTTPFVLYKDKIGEGIEKEETIPMIIGTALEDTVAKMFVKESGKRVTRVKRIKHNSDYPWALGNVDRKVVGENSILECKTTSSLPAIRQFRYGDYPDSWYCQVQHYMAVGKYDKAYIACLVTAFGGDFKTWEVHRDDAFISKMMEKEEEFWHRVTHRIPPDVTGHEDEYKIIQAMYPNSEPFPAYLESAKTDLELYGDISDQIKMLEKAKEACKERICMQMGTSDTGYIGKEKVCTWKEQRNRTFQWDKFHRDYPNFDLSAYTKLSNSRVFKLLK